MLYIITHLYTANQRWSFAGLFGWSVNSADLPSSRPTSV